MKRVVSDLCLIALLILLGVGFSSYLNHFFGPYHEKVDIELSFWHLPQYTFFSLSRGVLAYGISLVFCLSWGFWAAKDRVAEKFLIPLLDVLQSIPILGFLPGVVLFLMGIFKESNIGLELAAILIMFTGQVWNMVFGVYHAIRTVPFEKNECATSYGFTASQRFRWVELPFSALSLIWNSIMSVAGGWFFLMINEAFQLGNRDFRIPGLGSYMSVAAEQGEVGAMIAAIIAMIALIVFLDQLVWRPLVAWSQKFRVEETAPLLIGTSWFLEVLRNSYLISGFRAACKRLAEVIQNWKAAKTPTRANLSPLGLTISWVFLFGLVVLIGLALFAASKFLHGVTLTQWLELGKNLSLTFTRVYICVAISILIMLPLGLAIGLSEKWTHRLQPLIQTVASFPGSLLFPLLVLVFQGLRIPLGIGSLVLMLLGTQWYVLFNVLAGARAMPSDLREVAVSFGYSRMQRFFWLYLPAVFPYLITGILTAAGGAWNASVVAEYVTTKNGVLTTPGIGSSISLAAQNGDYPLLTASIFTMVVAVALLNYLVWLRLYHYSEKRFALNA